MHKVWKTVEYDTALASQLAQSLNVPHVVAGILVQRGIKDPEAAELFLRPRLSQVTDPFSLPAMRAAVERIWRALEGKERIVVFGDYDADGITSTALLVKVLRQMGGAVTPFLPHRVDDGYGLSADTLQKCLGMNKPSLVVTVDCGTSSADAVRMAGAAGVDVVITDHHEPGEEIAPACAVVNPKLGSDPRVEMLAGVGVAFKLCHALVKHARDAGHPAGKLDLRRYMDLVAVGTITDIVPLREENRILVRHGLEQLNKTELIGLRALADVAGVRGTIDAYHVGFMLGPRLNAMGRLGDAEVSLKLLMTEDASEAGQLATQLDKANRERQAVEARMHEEIAREVEEWFKPDQHFSLVLASDGWHPGVIGIVASRIAARFNRPTVLIALDGAEGRGSARSIDGFNLVENLQACGETLIRCGGHAMAAGLDIETVRVAEFRECFNDLARKALEGTLLAPVQRVDAWVSLADCTEELLENINAMQPFGFGNPRPVLAAPAVLVSDMRKVGSGKHLKLTLVLGASDVDAIGFGMGGRELPDGPMDVAFQLQRNSYMGRDKLQLSLQDFRPAAG